MYKQRLLLGGSTAFIGAPAKPLVEERLGSLREVVGTAPDVAFAYVPQMYVEGRIDPARQVLYLVLRDSAQGHVDAVMQKLAPAIHSRWPTGDYIDILPVFLDHPWLHDVIRTGCVLRVNDEEIHRRCVAESAKGAEPRT